jgi:hypothetical protein
VRRSWAKLLKRVFAIDMRHYPNCGGELEITAAILRAVCAWRGVGPLDRRAPQEA